jgi:hypothetical protein
MREKEVHTAYFIVHCDIYNTSFKQGRFIITAITSPFFDILESLDPANAAKWLY